MNASDKVTNPVELCDAELDLVSAGAKLKQSPIAELISDIKQFEETLLSDLGLGGSKPMSA